MIRRPASLASTSLAFRSTWCSEATIAGHVFQMIDHVTRADCAVHAYVLMTNHVHLLVTPTDTGQVGQMMQGQGDDRRAGPAKIGRPSKQSAARESAP